MNRKDIIHLGIRGRDAAEVREGGPSALPRSSGKGGSRSSWYLSISETARREVQLPYHKRMRVRMSPDSAPIVLPVVPTWRTAVSRDDTLLPIRVKKSKQGIVLGPIIGILTVQRFGTGTFRGNRANFRDIVEAGKRLGLTVVVFTPEGVSARETVDGYAHVGGKTGWRKVTVPLPSVVYNRVPDREAEERPNVMWVKKWLKEQGIPYFNGGFFNKSELFEILRESTETTSYLPPTETLTDSAQLQRWMRRQYLLYLKPVDGKAGDGIIQIRREGKGYHVTHQQSGLRTRTMYDTRQAAAAAVQKRIGGRAYLLQQGVLLASANGRPFDLRLLVQKNRYGAWLVTGVGARIADSDGITTHVPNGGQIDRASRVLEAAFGTERGRQIEERAREMALRIAQTLEAQRASTGELTGEMSMDIGVAEDGQLWFFEANAKPMKFDEPLIRTKSLLRLMHYCEFLAKTK
jgi:hypothetical protein